MLRIQSDNGLTLELEKDVTVEFELNNWLLSDSEDLPGSYSYPISFPLSDQNKRFLGHTHLPETKPKATKVSVWFNGVMLRQATLTYRKQGTGCSGYLKIDAGEIANKVSGRYLHEIFKQDYYFGANQANLRLLMKAAANATPGIYPFTFFPVYNQVFAPVAADMEDVPGYAHHTMINAWNGSDFVTANDRHVVPFLYLTHVIEKVCEFFGFTATGSFLQHPEVRALTIYNTQTLHLGINGVQPGIRQNLGLHLPYISIAEFLRGLRDDFAVGIFFDTSKLECRFELFKSIRDTQHTFKDLSQYLLTGDDDELPNEKGYTLISYQDSQDGFFKSVEPVRYKIREGQTEVKASIGSLAMLRMGNDGNQKDFYIPAAAERGNLTAGIFLNAQDYYSYNANHKNPFGFRLLSYRGMQPGQDASIYPMGSSVTRNYEQARVGSWSLDAKQQDSTFNQLVVPFYTFLAYSRRMRINLLLPISEAKSIKFEQIVGFRGENRVLVKSMISQLNLGLPGTAGQVLGKASVMLLLSPEATPNVYTGEMFYVRITTSNEYEEHSGDHVLNYVTLTFKVYADAALSVPANPTNLTIIYTENITTNGPGLPSTNVTNTYSFLISGHSHVLEDKITQDFGPQEQISISYGLATSSDYIAL